MKINISRLEKSELENKNVFSWPIWEKEVSSFEWHYDEAEYCYFLKGQVTVTTKDGDTVEFGKGDFVVFPKGLSCTWNIKSPVKKHYKFE